MDKAFLISLPLLTMTAAETNPNCSIQDHNNVYIGELVKKLKTAASLPDVNVKKSKKLKIAALLTTDRKKAAFLQALSDLHLSCKRGDDDRALQTLIGLASKAAALAHMAGTSAALTKLATLKKKTDTNAFTTGTNSAQRKRIAVDGAKTGINTGKCTIHSYINAEAPAGADKALSNWQHSLKVVKPDTTAATQGATQAMVCETTNGQCSSSSSGNTAGISSGTLYKTDPAAKQQTGKVKPSATTKEWVFHSDKIAHQAAQLDTELSDALTTYATTTDSCEPYNKLDNNNFILRVYKIAKGDDTATEIPQAERNNIKNIVESSYGKDPTTYEETIWKGVKATPLTKSNSGRPSDTKLDSITTLNDLQQIEAFIEASAAIKQNERSSASTSECKAQIETASACKGKEKKNCNSNCEWEGTEDKGTCKPKNEEEGVKVENDGKTNTNTTGGNSFVINKAPLLLAFLHMGQKLCQTFFLR
ncbi:variant surface glycoprotein (VSG, atypical), putative [Trypanosoma brucei brucei TREU927]|uniref:Variant surface glycoprotein (VSG, atypical), putative n=1 Tax=Trypanosoma brucei brucei (strain 927/4 GUTat10.1) TaxID=185431 RepID=Q586M4_TRYB2|nr:variant surface glycoprotein (VSG, atypical), putative [Trypanosoma brucei brucei TREU927]AAQ16093.1 variant surface glycoprotein (VSG, atypical), putative [Trypanosoma brucei brucei TREU927]AAX80337.1 variant surface glycoprotein (VSG, atypical), putative [Trypanosoma brucei]